MGEKLNGVECKGCGILYIPPKYMCSECGGTEFIEVPLSGEGTILTHTTIRVPPLGFEDQAPYDVAVIKLDDGINLTTQIISQGEKRPKVDDRVLFVEKTNGAYRFRLIS
jgi:uncharacterized OB-fold protein